MPKLGGLYCRMDDMCLGVECCVTIELLEMFQKTFRGYARFDLYDLALKLGFESWEYSFDFKQLIPGMFVDLQQKLTLSKTFELHNLELLYFTCRFLTFDLSGKVTHIGVPSIY